MLTLGTQMYPSFRIYVSLVRTLGTQQRHMPLSTPNQDSSVSWALLPVKPAPVVPSSASLCWLSLTVGLIRLIRSFARNGTGS